MGLFALLIRVLEMSSDTKSATDTDVSIVALAVALIALAITTSQLLGQYFATADGYRRCQPSVMGQWAKRTRRRWRWRQLRFETLFTTPQIMVLPFSVQQRPKRIPEPLVSDFDWLAGSFEWITGSFDSCDKTMVHSTPVHGTPDEMVCWIPLMQSLHRHELELERLGCYTANDPFVRWAGPAVRFRERSWDFMPPDVVRPHAITNISDIAVLARRLGMTWRDFRAW